MSHNILRQVIGYLVLSLPFFLVTLKNFGNLSLLLLSIVGGYLFLFDKNRIRLSSELKLFSWISVVYFLIFVLSNYVNNLSNLEDYVSLFKKLHFLLIPLLAISITQTLISIKHVLVSGFIGLFFGVIYQYYQYLHLNINTPSGLFNANIYGDILALYSIFAFCFVITQKSLFERFIGLAIFLTGFFGIALTGSRGSILAIFVLVMIALFMQFKSSKRKILIGLLAVLSLMTLFGLIESPIAKRFDLAYQEIEFWLSGEKLASSVGYRLEYIRSGLLAFKESPWIGYGLIHPETTLANFSRINLPFSHAHNEIINHLLSAGLLGFFGFTAILFNPFLIFRKNLTIEGNQLTSQLGFIFIIGFFLFGLTHITFQQEVINSVWMFYSVYLIAQIKNQDSGNNSP